MFSGTGTLLLSKRFISIVDHDLGGRFVDTEDRRSELKPVIFTAFSQDDTVLAGQGTKLSGICCTLFSFLLPSHFSVIRSRDCILYVRRQLFSFIVVHCIRILYTLEATNREP